MSKSNKIKSCDYSGTFSRKPLSANKEKQPVPTGWFVISSKLEKVTENRRKYRGKWFKIKSEKATIYRVLRYSPQLEGTLKNNQTKEIILDWDGWIELCGFEKDVDISLILEIKKAKWWELIRAGRMHPEPSYRLSTNLALLSVILGLLSVLLTIITFCK